MKEVGFDERKAKAAEALTDVGIEFEVADRLVAFGLVSPEAFEGVTAEDLVGLGFDDPVAQDILSKVSLGRRIRERIWLARQEETSPAQAEATQEEVCPRRGGSPSEAKDA